MPTSWSGTRGGSTGRNRPRRWSGGCARSTPGPGCGALNPWPGVWCLAGGERLKVLAATPLPRPEGGAAPGTILDGDLTVACGAGALRLARVQRPGKAPMAAHDLLRGFPLPAGTRLE
jgi:hypothetical protein